MLCLCASAYSQPAEQPQTGTTEQRTPNNNQGQPETPTINVTIVPPPISPEEQKRQRDREDRQDATNNQIAQATDRVASLTFWLVLVGVAQVVATALGFAVALRAANAAKRSADNAEKALTHAERAYINAADWTIESLAIGKPIRLHLKITNSGRTPGHLISTSQFAALRNRDAVPRTPTASDFHRIEGVNSFCTPKDSVGTFLQIDPPVDQRILDGLKSEQGYLWVYIEIAYTDVFQPKLTRWTRVCRRLHAPTMKMVVAPEANYDYAD